MKGLRGEKAETGSKRSNSARAGTKERICDLLRSERCEGRVCFINPGCRAAATTLPYSVFPLHLLAVSMMPPMVMIVSVSATVSATPMLNDVTTSQLFTSFWTCARVAMKNQE